MDLVPAQNYVKQGGVKIGAQDLSPQLYAIALKKGANALRDKINEALTMLQNNGTVAKLAQQYLKVPPEEAQKPQCSPRLRGWRSLGGRSVL